MKIDFTIGDSHSIFFEQSGLMKSHWTGPLHIATIYQLLKRGLNLTTLKEDLRDSDHYVNCGAAKWQCPNGIYETENIKPGDVVLFCFGFNDMQKNIHKYASGSYEEEIDKLISGYINLIIGYENKYTITPIICSIPPNPLPQANSVGLTFGISGDFITTGTSEERRKYNAEANRILNSLCFEYNLPFLNIHNAISDAEGFIKKEYTDDYIHLKWDNEQLKNLIKEKIDKL